MMRGNVFRQVWHLMRQNPMQSAIVVVGTAVTIAFVMIVVMNFYIRTSSGGAEPDRGRMVYVSQGRMHRADGTNVNNGLGRLPYDKILSGLPGVEKQTWHGPLSNRVCGLTESDDRVRLYARSVGEGWFDVFSYKMIAGKPFSVEDNREGVREVMLSRSAARRLSKSTPEELVGKDVLMDFKPLRVTGIYEDVSPLYQSAYADALVPFDYYADEGWFDGLAGLRNPLLVLKPGASVESVTDEVYRREKAFNNEGREYEYHFEKFYDPVGYSFFRDTMINPRLVNSLLVAVLLVVPALGIGGLINSQMQSRAAEIAVRKAYGAPDLAIVGRLFRETLVSTLLGACLGYLLAWGVLCAGGRWIFGDIQGDVSVSEAILERPMLLLCMVAACLVFTSLATIIPAWLSTRRSIASTLKGGER